MRYTLGIHYTYIDIDTFIHISIFNFVILIQGIQKHFFQERLSGEGGGGKIDKIFIIRDKHNIHVYSFFCCIVPGIQNFVLDLNKIFFSYQFL